MDADLHSDLLAKATELGFAKIGICAPNAIESARAGLNGYLAAGYHGTMDWMEARADWRGSPMALWPQAKSVIMLAEPYQVTQNPLLALNDKTRGAISIYAQNQDYHEVIKKRLKTLGRWLLESAGTGEIKVFVDTAPVMEKPLAAAAGLGWQGKHTNLLSRDLGNWFFLGAIFTTLDLPKYDGEDASENNKENTQENNCGSCRACLDICPTQAFPAPYQLDARRCISYLTIEYKGKIDEDLRPLLGNRIYGCDDCLAVCPWNKFAAMSAAVQNPAYHPRAELQNPPLADLARLDDTAFRVLFAKNPIKRIGRNQFIRNVLYAIGNSGQVDLLSVVRDLIADKDAVVRDAAIWAQARLEQTRLLQIKETP